MRRTIRPNKTFGLNEPTQLFGKLIYDIGRLRSPRDPREPRYAAIDCASDSWHLCDWVLESAMEEDVLRLTGESRNGSNARKGFLLLNGNRLPLVGFCQEIANTGKHLVIDMPVTEGLSTRGSWKLVPPFKPVVQILTPTKTYEAVDFFEEVASDWRQFLLSEGYQFPPSDEEIAASAITD